MDRLFNLKKQLAPNAKKKGVYTEQRPKNKLEWFKNNGWGFRDTKFELLKDNSIVLTGNQYEFCNQKMPKFKEWIEKKAGIDVNIRTPAQEQIPVDPPVLNEAFLKEAEGKFDEISLAEEQRIHHSHGHTMQELFDLRYGKQSRTVDAVVFINSHEQAVALVELAVKHNVCLMPYGGGTNVTWALRCRAEETRMIVSADVTRMNHVKYVDRKNMCALVECGILGKDLEKELARYGVVCGHEPDSVEFSSLGGWISTRASGMKKNKYGNIDDIVLQVKVVTPTGVYTRALPYPRVSSGPDLNQLILGSEGTLGIITEAVIKVRPQPQVQVFDSIIFHNFTEGNKFMYDVGMSRVWPASMRLVDNLQFQFGMALKTAPKDKIQEWVDAAKKYFVTEILKFNPEEMTLVTIVYEGSKEEVEYQQNKVNAVARKYQGFRAGSENGHRGYFLTFMIAYIRDFAFEFEYIAESFETSCAWKDVQPLCENVRTRIFDECKKRNVQKDPFVSFRVTQVYDTGAAVYVYFGFGYHGQADPVRAYSEIEDAARDEVMKCGGSISHHHGVGKLRQQFLERSIGTVGKEMLTKIKRQIDPQNIFGNGNLGI